MLFVVIPGRRGNPAEARFWIASLALAMTIKVAEDTPLIDVDVSSMIEL